MSTSADTVTYIEDQLSSIAPRIRTRKMFGEYALYCDEKVVALICDDQVFVKITPAGKEVVGESYQEGFPYPGAKPAMLVDGEFLEDARLFTRLITVTAVALPAARPKKGKRK